MKQPLLTIAIPTFNRAELLDKCLGHMLSQIRDDFKGEIELIVLNNDSPDHTDEVVNKYIDKGFLIDYYKHPENIGADRNVAACFLKAKGKYVWIFSDDDFILPGYLPHIITLIKDNDLGNIYVNGLWYSGSYEPAGDLPLKLSYEKYANPIDFVEKVNYWSTFITGNILNKSLYKNADHIDEFYDSCLGHLSWTLQIIFGGKENVVINDQVLACRQDNTGGYKLLHVFGKNLNDIIDKLIVRKQVDKKIKKIINTNLLRSFFPMFLKGDEKFEKENPLKMLLPVFWSYKLFWTNVFPKIYKR